MCVALFMKTIVWSFAALLAMASPSLAQDKKGYIGISLGPSIPLGDLASKDIDNESAGFATSGAIFDISVEPASNLTWVKSSIY